MALIVKTRGKEPVWGEECWFAPNATIIGDLIMGDECTVWFNAVVRADVNSIRIGNRVNIQDGVVIHCTYQKTATIIGNNVSLGHNAIVHGCTIEDETLIGMGAIVMDGAVVGKNSIIGAGAVVTENTIIPENTVWVGNPARQLKEITPELKEMFLRVSGNYIKYAQWFEEPDKAD